MPPPVSPTRVELGQLRELIADDRRAIGESRKGPGRNASLQTVAYAMPLHVQWRRAFRGNSRLKLAAWSACLCVVAAFVLWQAPIWNAPPARASAEVVQPKALVAREARELVAPRASPAVAALPAAAPAAEGVSQAEPFAPVVQRAQDAGLSPRMQLVRADAWLKSDSQRAAREARTLLESALAALPRDAHGHASLAEACLRLEDAACARSAIDQALEVRPLRSRYRALSQTIDAHFAR